MPRYTFSVIRFAPNPATGEFVNIGAVAGCDELRDWSARTVSSQSRARRIDDRGVMPKVFERVNELDALCAGDDEGTMAGAPTMSEPMLSKLYEQWQNVVQLSEPMPIDAASATAALDIVFAHLIVDPERQKRGYRNKSQAFSAVLGAYRTLGDDWAREHLYQRAIVKPAHHPVEFDFVVANGRVVQLAQTWSFEIPSAEQMTNDIRAWAWAVEEIRRTGASMKINDSVIEVPSDVEVEVVYLPPKHEGGERAFDEAAAAFKQLKVRAVRDDDVAQVASRAEELLSTAAE
jgi:hypothetical protein